MAAGPSPGPMGACGKEGHPPTYLFVHLLEEGDLLLQGLDAPFQVDACQRGRVHVLWGHGEQELAGGVWGEHRDRAQRLEGAKLCPGPWPGAGAGLLGEDGVGGEVGIPHPTGDGTGTHSSESSQVVLSLLLQLDLLLQPVGKERRSGTRGGSPVPRQRCPPTSCPRAQHGPVGRHQIVLHSRRAAGGLARGQGLFLPFPIIVNVGESTKA